MSLEQIRMARRFVSDFMYKTDATFNTNILKLPLSVVVGIDNTGSTFLAAYCYITLESAVSFKWTSEQLTDLAFLDCPEPALIIGDFSKGLGVAVAAKATADLEGIAPTDEALSQDPSDLLEATEVIVGKGVERPILVKLQLCEWHAVEAIKRKLVAAGCYKKERRDEIIEMIWAWVKAPTISALKGYCKELLEALHNEEQVYLCDYYQPKEPQFCWAYTRELWNLGANTTQRSEGYYVVVKEKLHKHLPLSKAVQIITD
jgi:MULE transposase domain